MPMQWDTRTATAALVLGSLGLLWLLRAGFRGVAVTV